MKILLRLHLVFYISLFAFMLAIPYNSMDANIFKMILFLVTLCVFILILTCYIVLSFNKEIKAIKKYIYANIVMMIIGIIGFLTLGHVYYSENQGPIFMIIIIGVLFIISHVLNLQMKRIVEHYNIDVISEVKLFYKMGKIIENTPISNAATKLDRISYGFCIVVFIAENMVIYICAIGIILLFSIKYLNQLRREFLKSNLVSKAETYFSIVAYVLCYLISIFWHYYFQNISTIIVGPLGLLFLKIYIQRIAVKIYRSGCQAP